MDGGMDFSLSTGGKDRQTDRSTWSANKVDSGDADKPIKGVYQGWLGLAGRLLVLSEMLLLGWKSLSSYSLIRKASGRFVVVGLTCEQP